MNNRFFTAIGLIVFFAITPASILAATTTVTSYDVEVVVFKNLGKDLDGDEIWSPERVNRSLTDLDKASKAAETTGEKTDIGKAALKISKNSDYQILAHKRWTQVAEARSTSPLMRINNEQGELDGTVVFYLSRFLHVDLQMLLQDTQQAEKSGETTAGEKTADSDAATQTMAYRIDESRRIRSEEIHYFDHPKFGILLQITPKES